MSIRLLFLGDSIAAEPTFSFVPLVVRGVAEHVDVSSSSINSSAPSSNVFDLLDRTQELIPSQEEPFDTAIVFVGINDSKIFSKFNEALVPRDIFASRLEMLVKRLEDAGSRVVLCGLPGLNFAGIEEGRKLKEFWYWLPSEYHKYNETIRSIAMQNRLRSFVDLDGAFSEFSQGAGLLYSPDGVHPSAIGHAVIADAIVPAVLENFKK